MSARDADARRVAEALARALQGSLLVRFAPSAVADAFGALPAGVATAPILERALVLA